MTFKGFKIGLVGPLPPPSGGMANQTRQLASLLEQEGATVEILQTNAPYRPRWIEPVQGLRALFRLLPYLLRLRRAAKRVDLFHVMANSGWAWHLFATPAIWIAKCHKVPVLVNYRGGGAEDFFSKSYSLVAPTMRAADCLVVPSEFLQQTFARFGWTTHVVPNVIDLGRFAPTHVKSGLPSPQPHIIVTRNLEPIYNIRTALEALALVKKRWPQVRMTIAGSGPDRDMLIKLADDLGLTCQVTFTGRLDNALMAQVYQQADLFVNPSLVDNMPISILEALASGVPVVTTDVGGIPFLVTHDQTALMVPPQNASAMAAALTELLEHWPKAERLAAAGREYVQRYSWPSVRSRLFDVYSKLVTSMRDA